MSLLRKLLPLVIFCCARIAFAQSCTLTPYSLSGPASPTANDIITFSCGSGSGDLVADPGSFQINGTTMQGQNDTQSLLIQGGQDGSVAQTYGGITIRGANVTDSGTEGGYGGSATVQGGDNFSPATGMGTPVSEGGALILRPGAATATAGDLIPGHLVMSQTFKINGTYSCTSLLESTTGCPLACVTGHDAVSDCGTGSSTSPGITFAGVELPAIVDGSNKAANVQVEGYTEVEAASGNNQTWKVGDIVCVDACNPGTVVDNGTNLCTTMMCGGTQYSTKQVGIVVLGGVLQFYPQIHWILLAR